eukprot:CAMPEP_0170564864 /NCGR_PEP_ID=MMETSP0211-20121228/75365_1 /TAXON_ID=311385 /ORGANISM="Pseudokeronopsis sp., Strain OXSARD2" /LENGTH=62 /DNA_ID=CAMNT_0010884883 /DNA_START=58 /DNA_END=246 /DNA_ORIENTATION=-
MNVASTGPLGLALAKDARGAALSGFCGYSHRDIFNHVGLHKARVHCEQINASTLNFCADRVA